MNPIAVRAEEALRASAHPALTLSELVVLIAPLVDRSLDVGRLRRVLEDHPDRFRVLDPWAGPWRVSAAGAVLEARDAWAVAVDRPDPEAGSPPTALELREAVRWLARGIDPRSPIEVSRWYAIVLAERAAREAVVRRAA